MLRPHMHEKVSKYKKLKSKLPIEYSSNRIANETICNFWDNLNMVLYLHLLTETVWVII